MHSLDDEYYGASLLLNNGGGFATPINTWHRLGTEATFTGNFYGTGGTDAAVLDVYGTELLYSAGVKHPLLSRHPPVRWLRTARSR